MSDADATRVSFFEEGECVGSCCSLRSGVVLVDTFVSEQATACGNMGEDRKNHLAQHKDQQLTRMKIFEVVSCSRSFICCVCPSSIWAPLVVASEGIGCVRKSYSFVASVS